ncbi:MAG: hypothetical protein GC168_20490 [Candidatus Hydrogenedens sp.]|nr:hypothetical protein [Candidatus Hydrogenedens sp.]
MTDLECQFIHLPQSYRRDAVARLVCLVFDHAIVSEGQMARQLDADRLEVRDLQILGAALLHADRAATEARVAGLRNAQKSVAPPSTATPQGSAQESESGASP